MLAAHRVYDYRRHRAAGLTALEALRALRYWDLGRPPTEPTADQRSRWQREDATRHAAIDQRIARYGY